MNYRNQILQVSILSLMAGGLNAQNLVPNPGFENYRMLPCRLNNSSIEENIDQWFQPLPTSTDYFRTDIDEQCDLNPARHGRYPRTGNAMAGVVSAMIAWDRRTEYKEYLEVKLNRPLAPGKLYCGEFFAFNRNLPELSDVLECNNLSMAFSDTAVFFPISINAPDHLLAAEAARITGKPIIPADDKWHRVEGCFGANKHYRFLLIGNFHSVHSTEIVRKSFVHNLAGAYYYIDDVSLIELPYNAPALPSELDYCHSDNNLILNASAEGATDYTWHDGSKGPHFEVTNKESANYSVTISYGRYTLNHVFRVRYIPDIDLGPDILLCREETISLEVTHPLPEYVWSDGSNDNVKLIKKKEPTGLM